MLSYIMYTIYIMYKLLSVKVLKNISTKNYKNKNQGCYKHKHRDISIYS